MKKTPTVVILGRINVGKSALFNRLSDTTKAIVSPQPGTTRDYNQANVDWQKKRFTLIDTGGIDSELIKNSIAALISKKKQPKPLTSNPIELAIVQQTKQALQKADLILLVTDIKAGVMPADRELALALKKFGRPLIVVCNKADGPRLRNLAPEFFKLGLGTPHPVSAVSGSGTGDLLDVITKKIKGGRYSTTTKKIELPTIRLAVVGKPNVGKSSLVNRLLDEPRVIVTPIAQTTREPQDTELIYKDYRLIIIDTAGLRKAGKIGFGIERIASDKARRIMEHADVALLITEVHGRLAAQDSRVAGLVKDSRPGIIIIGNKWDLLRERGPKIDTELITYYRRFFGALHFAPLLFTSAATGRGVEKIFDQVIAVWQQRQKAVSERQLERLMKKAVKIQRPVQARGPERPRLYALKQTGTNPPVFTVTIGKEQSLHFSYLRFLENMIRKQSEFTGVPITIKVVALKHLR